MGAKEIPAHPEGKTMKAVCFSSFSKDPSGMQVKEIPQPVLSNPKHVLIKIHAAAFNPIDKVRLSGGLKLLSPEKYSDSVIGYDCSGVIEEVGSEVENFNVGDAVFVRLGGMRFGAAAEYAVADAVEVAKKPENITFAEAASIPLAGLTALQAMRTAGVKEGSKVLITGGAGGVGSLAIQIAKQILGAAEVVTTARAGPSADLCTSLGADRVIDYSTSKFEETLKGENFDAGFDTTNESHRFAPVMKEGSHVVTIAGTPTVEAISNAGKFGNPNMLVRFFLWATRNRKAESSLKKVGAKWSYIFMTPLGSDLDIIGKSIQDGNIKPVVFVNAPSIEKFGEAAEALWGGHAKGKCVVSIVSEAATTT